MSGASATFLPNSEFQLFDTMRRSTRITRQSASALETGAVTENSLSSTENESILKTRAKKRVVQSRSDASNTDDGEEYAEPNIAVKPRVKRRKVVARSSSNKTKNSNAQLHERLFKRQDNAAAFRTNPGSVAQISLPSRAHGVDYHRPLLLDSRQGRESLLQWFDTVSTTRKMPWRKAWINPTAAADEIIPGEEGQDLRRRRERRAYEVWISEIMLQQTRVAVVIDYWNRWMARWPTIHDLAAAHPDDVLAAWRGLGYYSRATRIHDAANIVCEDPSLRGLLPSAVDELVAKVPGVGRYTAGAISAIVFGRAAPMVDGNVLRVLSRQLGLFGDVKADKSVIDLLWAAADSLVKAVARDESSGVDHVVPNMSPEEEAEDERLSDRPGRWGQALMELGSTVCTPKPNCAACPISLSCRAYDEGLQLAAKRGLAPKSSIIINSITDIEDACTLCKPFEEYTEEDGPELDGRQSTLDEASEKKPKTRIQTTLQAFAFTQHATSKSTRKTPNSKTSSPASLSTATVDIIANHARKFPIKTAKKAVREEETLVCAIRRDDGRYLTHRRPEKGLLAGLWELPSCVLEDALSSTAKTRRRDAEKYVAGLVNGTGSGRVKHVGELGSVPWLFSHLKLTMHVHLFEFEGGIDNNEETRVMGVGAKQSRWSDPVAIDEESMGTGMRKCWALVREASEG
ncbi:DNA glycosylase [Hypoxylon crocopeplum]|nr:DNA glycosylase [Hypoxylon crocopeplum]